MTKKIYIELALPIGSEHFEFFIAFLMQEGIENFYEDGDTLKCYVLQEQWTSEMKSTVQHISRQVLGNEVAVGESIVEEKNWNEEFEKTLTPIEVSDRFAIVQSGSHYDNTGGRMLLEINPKMSFGTGYHETTRLMIRLMEKVVKPSDRVLDIGTGTGVLAIAAVKLGVTESVVAFDNDEWSVENAIENVQLNHVADSVIVLMAQAQTGLDHILQKKAFSLVLANINIHIILACLPTLSGLVSGTTAIFSGLLIYDEAEIVEALTQHGFQVVETAIEGEWLALVTERN
jgi:ribosomal protein L11 methyltransferase